MIKTLILTVLSSSAIFSNFLFAGYLMTQVPFYTHHIMVSHLCGLFFFLLSSFLLTYLNERQCNAVNTKRMARYLPNAWQQLLSLPLVKLTRLSSTELASRICDYETGIADITLHIFSLAGSLLLACFLFGYLFYNTILLAVFYFVTFLLLITCRIIFYPTYLRYTNDHFAAHNKALAFFNDSLLQIHKIKTANAENIIHKKWLQLFVQAKQILFSSHKLENLIWLVETIIIAGLTGAAFLFYDNFTLLLCCSQLALLYNKLSTAVTHIIDQRINLKRLDFFLSLPVEKSTNSVIHYSCKGDIRLANVSFNKLQNIFMHVEAGSFVGLTGNSGAGKSTLLRLILGLESPNTGSIFVDNINIKDFDMALFRKNVGVVLQTTNLFGGTIFSNIKSNTHLTLDEAWRLAEKIGLAEDIATMPMKMFTYISDQAGDSISGGQRQKILIARALATKPKILLLDEATSALDNDSQAIVFNHLKSLNITRLVIAHRLSTLAQADIIYHLENGIIKENGRAKENDGNRRTPTALYQTESL